MSHKIIMVMLFGALVLRELWILLPTNEATFDPFPLYDIQITRPTHVAFACGYASMMILTYCFSLLMESERLVMYFWFCLQAVEFLDYFLTYNTAWFSLMGFGIGITVIKFTTLFTVILYRLWRT